MSHGAQTPFCAGYTFLVHVMNVQHMKLERGKRGGEGGKGAERSDPGPNHGSDIGEAMDI
uniref:Uncharacterized protein n=1 Tax=Oryza barthii TaxID=65489 RepID=A0A0D3EWX7_9ORYZ